MDDWYACIDHLCPKCKGLTKFRVVESSDGGHEDTQHKCIDENCGYSWWTDGPDA